MDLSGEYVIEAPPARVRIALKDPRILQIRIPDSTEPTRISEHGSATSVSPSPDEPPVGKLELTETQAPDCFGLTCRFGNGEANVWARLMLSAIDAGTRVTYTIETGAGSDFSRLVQSVVEGDIAQFLAGFTDAADIGHGFRVAASARPDANLVSWAKLMFGPTERAGPRTPA
ncbi:hypothetical protein FJ987_19705 [Mesorhizobium sp. CU2]|uniref:hypothetical protein n=1 Tax=unclassified Mesorhizobium TaxID=325217 RepID=UPI00112787F7|nr:MULTISPECIES: hypothetical protein [unclassified Mesorhizobium]TPN85666.1 hypothetical protein FJ988_08920 [Mesorhizobium sp. CU3]TPO11023.1 hypothetical protein FJ987_19705 [Mesorhizobium sp. CU2]